MLACPLRCKSGFDGCNKCDCNGLGNTAGCTKINCVGGTTAPAACSKCEIGYTLNTVTNSLWIRYLDLVNSSPTPNGIAKIL